MTRLGATAVRILSILAVFVTPIAFVISATILPAVASTEKRVALVIGNGDYRSVPGLPNPVSDAKSVAASLTRLGFSVTDGYDLKASEMRAKIAAFSATLPDAKAAVIYYAGHGVSVDGENFLIPTDMVLKSPTDLDLQAISMSLLLKQLKREERVNVVILDACRDNPFAGDLAHAKTRAMVGDRGLSPVNTDLAKGTLIAYASDPNSTALDGKAGEGSPFTRALLHHLEDPDVPIGTVMDRVRTEVWDETGNRQMPWVNTSLIGEFLLNQQTASLPSSSASISQPQSLRAATPEPDRFALENRLWDSAERGNSLGDYQAYLESYPSGLYAPMARGRIAKLTPADVKGQDVAQRETTDATATAAIKNEVGTQETEASLNFDSNKRRELQARLAALNFDVGGVTGELDMKTRTAIVGWQKNHGAPPTGWLGPIQYAALRKETDTSYQNFLFAKPEAPKPQTVARSRSLGHAVEPHHRRVYQTQYASPRYRQQNGGSAGGMDPAGAAMLGGLLGGVIGRFH